MLSWRIWISCPQLPPASFSRARLTQPIQLKTLSSAVFRGRHVVGGVYRRGLATWRLCVQWCTGSCVAVDFDSADGTCWHHTEREACSATLRALYTSTHYRMNACGAVFDHRQLLAPGKFSSVPLLFFSEDTGNTFRGLNG